MTQDSGFDTGVSTINPNIQELLSERDYLPSYMAKIINRAIEDKRYKTYRGFSGLKKGHFVENYESFHEFSSADITINSSGKALKYPRLTMPSSMGSRVINELDTLVKNFNPRSLDEDAFYNFLAMIVLSIGSAHAFPDGNGRTAIGIADIYIRKYTGNQLDREKMQRFDKRLTIAMTIGSVLMLPSEYNPNTILNEINHGEIREVIIPTKTTHSTRYVQQFAEEYADTIISNIRYFDPHIMEDTVSEPFSLLRDSILPIAALLKETTI